MAQKIPEDIDLADAAPLMCAGITVWSPISRYITRPGMKVQPLFLNEVVHAIGLWLEQLDESIFKIIAVGADCYVRTRTGPYEPLTPAAEFTSK